MRTTMRLAVAECMRLVARKCGHAAGLLRHVRDELYWRAYDIEKGR